MNILIIIYYRLYRLDNQKIAKTKKIIILDLTIHLIESIKLPLIAIDPINTVWQNKLLSIYINK